MTSLISLEVTLSLLDLQNTKALQNLRLKDAYAVVKKNKLYLTDGETEVPFSVWDTLTIRTTDDLENVMTYD